MKIETFLVLICLGCILILTACKSCEDSQNVQNLQKLKAANEYIHELEEYIGYDKLMDTVGSGDAYWKYHKYNNYEK